MTIEHDTETNTLTARLSHDEYACFQMGRNLGESEDAKRGRRIASAIADERQLIMTARTCPLPTVRVIVDFP